MKVFITGATGYVGAYLVKRLENEGHIVHALVRSIDKASFIKSDNIKYGISYSDNYKLK